MSKWVREKDKSKWPVSEESADAAVFEFLDFYGIELVNNPEKSEGMEEMLDAFRDYYRQGLLENKHDEDKGFSVIQYRKNGGTITYREMNGKDRLEIERYKPEQAVSRSYELLGRLSGLGKDAMSKLMGEDYRIATILSALFLVC